MKYGHIQKMMKAENMKFLMAFLIAISISGCGNSQFKLEDSPEYKDFKDILPASDIKNAKTPEEIEKENHAAQPDPNPTPSTPSDKPNDPQSSPTQTNPPSKDGFQGEVGIGSVYYMPVLTEKRKCEEKDMAVMKDAKQNKLADLCAKEIYDCRMQGSCYLLTNNKTVLFSYKHTMKMTVPDTKKEIYQPVFVINKEHELCPTGMGAQRICVDPYFSVAADLNRHKMGDVIYVPKVRGAKLPNGVIHDGYFVVRDIGTAITGAGRFDFFIGFDSYLNHVFTKLNLSNPKKSTFIYYRATEDIAKQVRANRNYPRVPEAIKLAAVNHLAEKQKLNQTPAAQGLVQSVSSTEDDSALDFYKIKFQ